MADRAVIDFWFSIGSTYTYLSVMRLQAIEHANGVRFRWRPFNVRAIMMEMNNIPFAGKPSKMAYMWKDLERRAQLRGVAFSGPPPYPLKDLARANRLALVGLRDGWGEAYVRAAYRRWFLDRKDASTDEAIRANLAEAGQNPELIIARAESDEAIAALAAETETAKSLGVFGSPTFAVGHELFWGDDRLEDAVAWQRHGRLAPAP